MKMLRDSFIQKLFIKLTMVFILSCLVFYFIPNILVLIISFLFLIGLVYQYLKKRNDQVEELTQYIKTLNSGNYHYFLEAYDEGELGILYSELNKTMVTLRTMNSNLQDKNDFINSSFEDISHQIKTPITALSILTDLRSQDDELVLATRDQVNRLDHLISAIMKLIQLETAQVALNIEKISLECLVKNVLSDIYPLIKNQKIKILVDVQSDVYGDVGQYYEALYNILVNKIKYAETTIWIEDVKTSLTPTLNIYDDGPEIRHDIRDRVFERFFTTHHQPNSLGIGLSVARQIMILHDGNIRVKDANTFTILFPNVIEPS